MTSVLDEITEGADTTKVSCYRFWCLGCKDYHLIRAGGEGWYFNGDLERPSFQSSYRVSNDPDTIDSVCHYYIYDGYIYYLEDCTHTLAGAQVPLDGHLDIDTTPTETETETQPQRTDLESNL